MNLAMSKFQPSQSAPTKLRPSSTSSSGSGNDKLVAKLRDQNRLLTKVRFAFDDVKDGLDGLDLVI